MQSHQQPSPGFGLDAAREFTARATWTFAKTMPWAPHEYTVRQRCRAQGIEAEFEAFVVLIESDAGHWRPWGSHRWRSLNLDAHTYWLHWNRVDSVAERTIVNRRHRDQMGPRRRSWPWRSTDEDNRVRGEVDRGLARLDPDAA